MGRTSDAVSSLVQFLSFSPTDGEGWAELADLYLTQGMYQQAIYALEEVLVMAPNAWNVGTSPPLVLITCPSNVITRYMHAWARCSTWRRRLLGLACPIRNAWPRPSSGFPGASSCVTTTSVGTTD